jgi:hypothetical protein
MLASSAVDRGFEPRSGQTKYTKYQTKYQLLSGLNATFLNLNNSEKLKLLLSEYPRKTARYLVQSLAKRKNHLYLNN